MRDPREVLTREAPGPRFTAAYGEHPDHVIDVWLPTGEPTALVIFIHGGFWRAEYDRRHVRPLCVDLASRGYAAAAIEYRRTGWPALFDDVAAALDGVPRLVGAAKDTPIVVAGHSAGGHLALWAAVRHRLPETSPWRLDSVPPFTGVLALAPVADLAAAYREDLDEGAAAALLDGGPHDVPDRYAVTDPATLPPPDAATTLIHGARDETVPAHHSRRYAARTGATLIELPDAEHFGLIDPLSAAWPHVVAALRDMSSA